MVQNIENKKQAFVRLLNIMDELREKCPWDKKQTIQSLRYLSIEELYELSDAIMEEDFDNIKKELGDLMLHVVFYAKIGEEKQQFDMADVLNTICEKLIHRHPHIYGDVKVQDEKEVKRNWEKLKLKENGKKSVMQGVPKSLPAVVKAIRIQEKARGVGFEWDTKKQVWEKVEEELNELKTEIGNKSDKIEEEFGDLLFSLINYSRFINVNAEDALEKTNKKFLTRFQHMEAAIKLANIDMTDMSLKQLDAYWEKAKQDTQ